METTRLRTPDLYFAAALLALGAKLTATEREGRRVFWHFEDVEPEWPNEWLMDTLMVPGKSYASAARSLKTMVHEEGF